MPGPGRNDPCPCGSGRKVKRCCGQRRGPSEEQLARAHVARLAREALPDLAGLTDSEIDRLIEDGLFELPALDLSLLVRLPDLVTPDLQRLREAIARGDPDWGWDALTNVGAQIDTPKQRADLADAAARLRDQGRIDRALAAVAIFDLDTRSTRFLGASLLQAVAISVGVEPTAAGLYLTPLTTPCRLHIAA
jgi:hypothetical protein